MRLSQFQLGLLTAGIALEIQSLLGNDYLHRRFAGGRPSLLGLITAFCRRLKRLRQSDSFDLAIVYGELLPFLPGWLERRFLKTPFIYDLDDAFYLKYRTGRSCWLQPLLGGKCERMMVAAVAVTAGNAELATYALRFNSNVMLLPSVVDTDHYFPAEPHPSNKKSSTFIVGWIGSPSTALYLMQLVEPLQQLALEHAVCLHVVGGPAPSIAGVEVIEQRWSLEQDVPMIQQFDVGVMPLPDSQWARGKCAYKLIQCMACGIPVIASPVGANVAAVPGSCGILANSTQQWLAAFRQLAGDPEMRRRMGAAGRQWVVQHYSQRSVLPDLTDVILRASADHPKA